MRWIGVILGFALILCAVFGQDNSAYDGRNLIEFDGVADSIWVATNADGENAVPVSGKRMYFSFGPGQTSGYYYIAWRCGGRWYGKWFRVSVGKNVVHLYNETNHGLDRDNLRSEVDRHIRDRTMTVVVDGNCFDVPLVAAGNTPLIRYYAIILSDKDDVERAKRISDKLSDKSIMVAVVNKDHWRVSGASASVGEALLYNSDGKLIGKWTHSNDDDLEKEIANALNPPLPGLDNMNVILIIAAIVLIILLLRKKE
jgi:hypothetical protein